MPIFGIFSLLFGIFIIFNPDFIAYIIGFLFIFLGVNSFILFYTLKKRMNRGEAKTWSFGNYEIIKKK